ncbi:MAG: hypothetical protein ABI818_10255, partial [Acidobacteriota bacterium]
MVKRTDEALTPMHAPPARRSRLLLGIAMAATVALGGTFAAQESGGGRGRGFGPPGSALLLALDADHDGSLSASEVGSAAASLKQFDRNGDGRISADELPRMFGRGGREGLPGRGGRGDEPGETRPTTAEDLVSALMAFDANHDSVLTKAEVPARLQGLFDRADVNRDGQLTTDELKQSAAAQPQPADSRDGGRGERDGRGQRGRDGDRPGRPPDPLLA